MTFINCVSVRLATLVQNVFFFGKLLAIGIIICVGFYTHYHKDLLDNVPCSGFLGILFPLHDDIPDNLVGSIC